MTTQTTPTTAWVGRSGKSYTFYIYPIGTIFTKAEPGNYIFAKRLFGAMNWTSVYTGETEDLSQRFDNHHKMPCIKQNGATHIHVHVSSTDARVRRAEESDLIQLHHPPCNG